MAISEYASGTETVSTTEWSLTTDTSGPDADTTDGVYQFFIDFNALQDGDAFEFRVYEKVLSTSTQRVVLIETIQNTQLAPVFVSPSLVLIHGWDATVLKVAGTDRSIDFSVRQIS